MSFVSFVSYPPSLEITKIIKNLGDTPTDKTDKTRLWGKNAGFLFDQSNITFETVC